MELAEACSIIAFEQAIDDVVAGLPSHHYRSNRGQYKKYTPELRAKIGLYAVNNGNMEAARKFNINESTVRGIKRQYCELYKRDGSSEITSLPVKKQGRPLLLGTDLDKEVKKCIKRQRSKGAVVTRFTVIAIARAIVMKHNRCLLSEFGGTIKLTKEWAKSILHRMKYVKRKFLPMQLIYTGKTSSCHPKGISFPADWHITHTHNHWANEDTINDYVRQIIIPYINKTRDTIENRNQPALVIFDVFKGQLCQSTMDLLQQNNIHFVHVPPNCTDRLQPLDVSVNKSCKDYMKKQFVDWYSDQILQSLDDDTDFTVDLRLSVMKPLGAKWLISFFNYIADRPHIVFNGFKAAGIAEALNYSMDTPPTIKCIIIITTILYID